MTVEKVKDKQAEYYSVATRQTVDILSGLSSVFGLNVPFGDIILILEQPWATPPLASLSRRVVE